MEQRVSLITLSVADLARAKAFYAALGWRDVSEHAGIVAFNLLGQALGLYPRDELARDMGVPVETLGHGGMTLAHNLREKDEVDGLAQRMIDAGATVLKPPHEVFWGGYIAYLADPDGHVWELAWNPMAPPHADGAFQWEAAPEA
ncbi:Glyoxalase-like domain protein [Aquimixticola soesokkakensis]|uniref:Glyoxalase-like domain protein n=1 Tax=Aquimixticola soesokkakensis TaxID=1519096 RepID=A0A1Y5SWA0_9RHOB|nr:VOC family protein [Aquimixticola soesokkakensis]SLN50149.1 Glyoxalase-like domain protein [Aquimixticola soesokkakensis]